MKQWLFTGMLWLVSMGNIKLKKYNCINGLEVINMGVDLYWKVPD